ncbi:MULTISPECIES: hypothetical protein [Cyanophyceae]|uniref:hypothetical protein n=1 Tax=Cyanophyceae TaxID=3028117 RepID=UPI001686D6FB|nr:MULTISPECIES: hypothetical protein [Cyanophyceae]MBD1916134.1 hypothetical protein [Phormidium sp. FACHB-77]MBD2031597.1 hypothetical protein [Phormidium sp. FACHB-322]MBD2052776.1 hypothetical protein [Leptolyngbya sp. FACHB-60]
MKLMSRLTRRNGPNYQGQPYTASLWARLALAALVGFGGVTLPSLVTPPVAQAYTSRVNLYLVREQGESFETLVQRSEIIARAAIQRSFDADVLMTDVIVTVIGDNQGITVPILTVPVSRSEWRLQPDVPQWANYFEAARALVYNAESAAP